MWIVSFIIYNFFFFFILAFGDTFAGIGVREPQPRASEAFRQFGDYHRQMEKGGIKMLKSVKPVSASSEFWNILMFYFYVRSI